MTEKEIAELKDRILSLANRKGEGMYFQDYFLNSLAPGGLDDDLVISLINQIGEDGNLKLIGEFATKTDHPDDFMMFKTPEGVTFFDHQGGYLKQYKDQRKKRIWEFFKKDIVAVGGWIVAVITLIYTIFFK